MKKKIDEKHIFYFFNNYPFKSSFYSSKKNFVTVGVGGNTGKVIKTFNKLFLALKSDCRFDILSTSPILQNPPFGYLEQNDFLNAVIVLKTNLSPFESLRQFQRYEKRFKRKRTFQDAPRTLDIDIIFFNDLKIDKKDLTIPHKGYKNRPSVQMPLKYLTR